MIGFFLLFIVFYRYVPGLIFTTNVIFLYLEKILTFLETLILTTILMYVAHINFAQLTFNQTVMLPEQH